MCVLWDVFGAMLTLCLSFFSFFSLHLIFQFFCIKTHLHGLHLTYTNELNFFFFWDKKNDGVSFFCMIICCSLNVWNIHFVHTICIYAYRAKTVYISLVAVAFFYRTAYHVHVSFRYIRTQAHTERIHSQRVRIFTQTYYTFASFNNEKYRLFLCAHKKCVLGLFCAMCMYCCLRLFYFYAP